MRKLGLIGRWASLPAAGVSFTLEKPRQVEIEVNTMDRVTFWVEYLPGPWNAGEVPPAAFLGAVDGLETFDFRVAGPFRFKAVHYDPNNASEVWYATQEGLNFAIDGEHLRDFTVPMIGRRERNEEMDRLRFEMRQEMRQQAEFFKEFLQFQNQRAAVKTDTKQNGKGNEAQGDTEDQSGDTKPEAGGAGGDKNNRRRSQVDPKRPASKNGDVQQSADEGDTDGRASADT